MSQEPTKNNTKTTLYIVVGVLVIASIAFRFINDFHFETTSILFVGLPALITLLMIKYTKTPKTAYGVVFKVITLFLLMSAILLGEGIVCVIFMAPIFYGVATLIVFIAQLLKKKKKSKLFSVIILPIIILVAQPFDGRTKPKIQKVQTAVVIDKTVSFDAFNKSPDFLKNYPEFFKIGFPKPIAITGTGTHIGSKRDIQFESKTKGIGTLSLAVITKNEAEIVFKAIHDNTHINHWLTWKQMRVEISPLASDQTKISWTSEYYCDLGPGWYFEPLEQFVVNLMNSHLIHAYFN